MSPTTCWAGDNRRNRPAHSPPGQTLNPGSCPGSGFVELERGHIDDVAEADIALQDLAVGIVDLLDRDHLDIQTDRLALCFSWIVLGMKSKLFLNGFIAPCRSPGSRSRPALRLGKLLCGLREDHAAADLTIRRHAAGEIRLIWPDRTGRLRRQESFSGNRHPSPTEASPTCFLRRSTSSGPNLARLPIGR